jgi:hypothetical protein
MAEIKTPLLRLAEGETFTAGEDGAFVITDAHTHSDILRYVVADVGKDHAAAILDLLEDCPRDEASRGRQ